MYIQRHSLKAVKQRSAKRNSLFANTFQIKSSNLIQILTKILEKI